MTILRSGSNEKYSQNWTAAFGGGAKSGTKKVTTKKSPTKATAKKGTKKTKKAKK